MKKDAKKRQDESEPSCILASCGQSMRQVCSMDFLKERLNKCFKLAMTLYLKKVAPPCLGPLLRPGHAHRGLHSRPHHRPHSHTTGDRWISICSALQIQNFLPYRNDIYIFAGYAPLAGLPLQYGLYASIIPGFTYCLLGTTRQSLHT